MGYGFTFINKQGVESRDGFRVQFTGRFSLEYRNGSFVMECYAEPGAPEKWVEVPELPYGNLTAERRAEIVNRISAALDFMGVPHTIR
jgi:hypothetical protein